MKVAFDSRPASGPSGIARYARSLRAALAAEADRRGGEIIDAHRPRGVDLFHSPWIDGAQLRPRQPMVVTLHDLIPLKRPGEYLRSGLRFRMRYLAVERATRIMVPTAAVAEDAVAMLNVEPARVHVVPYAPDPAFSPRDGEAVAGVRERYSLPEDYLVWVGGLRHPDPRKRVAALADTPSKLPIVLVGDAGAWAHELPSVILTGAVDDDDLAAIYTGARALVFPSDDEGFGLPPVEALACGTPVIVSDLPVLREVLGTRATFVDPDDLEEMVAAGAAAERPAPQPPAWSWDDAARATWDVYEFARNS